jgi:protein required for attachment to host cells
METVWTLVANRANAVILSTRSRNEAPRIVDTLNHPESRLSDSELVETHPGQKFTSRGVARHTIEPKHTPHDLEATGFARQLSGVLGTAADRGGFDRLILVAPAPFLGELRQALGALTDRVALEVTKDIAGHPTAEIVASVRKIIDDRLQSAVA